jgi:hypothetical protein
MCTVYDRTTFHMCDSSGAVVIAMRLKADYRLRAATTSLSCILRKEMP